MPDQRTAGAATQGIKLPGSYTVRCVYRIRRSGWSSVAFAVYGAAGGVVSPLPYTPQRVEPCCLYRIRRSGWSSFAFSVYDAAIVESCCLYRIRLLGWSRVACTENYVPMQGQSICFYSCRSKLYRLQLRNGRRDCAF